MKFRAVIYCALLCIPAFGISSCTDDLLDVDREIGEGESRVNATVEFKPLTPALNGKTRAAGDAIKAIENLCVLLYDAEGKLVKKYSSVGTPADFTFTTNENVNRPGSTTETATPRATFSLKIPYGRHYIYAVANMGDLASYDEDIKTVEGLKSISLTWNPNAAALNNQMFGHFTEPDYPNDEAPLLTVDRKDMALHARIRRAASKVTVAFDGSGLEEGVFVYLHSVQIRDIPANCLLGDTNTVAVAESGLIAEGETIDYVPEGSESVEDQSVRVTKGRPYFPYDETDPSKPSKDTHSETAPALFFYENMQGKGNDKTQKDEDSDGMPDNADRVKDGKPCGTYIEVKGYYQSVNPERLGSGPIIYRFMLGKNVTDDYNAERNHHYKLTLKFNRFANDADWHIEYTEQDPDLIVPQYYFVSYLYNHEAKLPVKINAEGHELVGLEAVIDINSWAPFEAYKTGLDYRKEMDPDNPDAYKDINYPWNGFLSLRKTELTDITGNASAGNSTVHSANRDYYEKSRRGERTYFEDGTETENTDNYGKFTHEQKDGTYVFNLPLYTRAKKLITVTGYTGNNPYVAYLRHAVVRFTATLRNTQTGDIVEKESKVHVMQTRRVVNPKGIWRKHNSTRSFHVVLKTMPYESSETFQTFVSEGKWRAYVVRGDKNLVSLNGSDRVEGSTGTPVDFTVGFRGTCGPDESRCAVIRVEYHDYACVHLIFVRQGKASMALVPGGVKWRACNMRTKTREASCPVEEGSLFRFGNWNDPIDATNNENPTDYGLWVNVQPEWFADDKDKDFLIAGTNTTKKWNEILCNSSGFEDIELEDGTRVSVARYDDYQALMTDDIEFGYGVMYGDDAGETLDRIEEVYGHRYDRHGEAGAAGAGYGMRGVFVYNKSTDATFGGRSLFFPVGVSGYGSRKRYWLDNDPRTAVLRYGSKKYYSDYTHPIEVQRPLLFDLFRHPGALYWLGSVGSGKIAWDMNYFSFGFDGLNSTDAGGGSNYDAYFVRCVERE